MKRQLLSGLLALVLVMTGCSGAGSPAGTKEAEAAQETTQEAEEIAAQEATQMSAQEEDQTSAEGTETQQTAKGIRGLSASEFEPIESENGNHPIRPIISMKKNPGKPLLWAFRDFSISCILQNSGNMLRLL